MYRHTHKPTSWLHWQLGTSKHASLFWNLPSFLLKQPVSSTDHDLASLAGTCIHLHWAAASIVSMWLCLCHKHTWDSSGCSSPSLPVALISWGNSRWGACIYTSARWETCRLAAKDEIWHHGYNRIHTRLLDHGKLVIAKHQAVLGKNFHVAQFIWCNEIFWGVLTDSGPQVLYTITESFHVP